MASRKNRTGKANRRSPRSPPPPDGWVARRLAALSGRLRARRWLAIVLGVLLLFGGSLVGGYFLAQSLDRRDVEQVAREALDDMRKGAPAAEPAPRYARIEDLPELPKYTEVEPGQARPSFEEKPRPRVQPAAASATGEAWRRNAVPFRDLNSRPLVAVVIDDVGLDRPRSKRAWELPGPLTMSFLPYAKDLREQARAARARGHELMLHLPMEPNGRNDPGPNALLVSLTDAEIRARTTAALDSFEGFAGVNNHMGSRFTTFRPGMETVLRQLKGRGLMFLDSRTSAQSVGDAVAHETGVPSIVRHVFLDDDESLDSVRRKLAEAEAIARRQGFVVVIGHPHESTLVALAEWLPTTQGKGLALAPATAVLRKRNGWD
ncbi:MAG: divergent polysaccharide deacetylase family protein [Proteobacteria bacterium]|nr:divergent polysaccharide deacetylase family protein [Pseudomonadota bacterium]